jgi:hypothetical protein
MEKKERLEAAFEHLRSNGSVRSQLDAAKAMGTGEASFSRAMSGHPSYLTDRFLKRFNAAFGGVFSNEWLISGEGEMLARPEQTACPPVANCESARSGLDAGLPLVPFDALAGLPGGDLPGIRLEDCERYVVPEFSRMGADCLVRVAGASMQPRYLSGDLLAVRRLSSATFLQWGKVYVLDTEQGLLVKKLMPCDGDEGCVLCVSENEKEFPPFRLPKAEIRSLSIVVGHVSVE